MHISDGIAGKPRIILLAERLVDPREARGDNLLDHQDYLRRWVNGEAMGLKSGTSPDRQARQAEEKDRAVEVIRQAIASFETVGRQPSPWEKVVLADAISGAWRGWYSSVAVVVRELSTPPSKGCHPLEPMLEKYDLASFKRALDVVDAGDATPPPFNPARET